MNFRPRRSTQHKNKYCFISCASAQVCVSEREESVIYSYLPLIFQCNLKASPISRYHWIFTDPLKAWGRVLELRWFFFAKKILWNLGGVAKDAFRSWNLKNNVRIIFHEGKPPLQIVQRLSVPNCTAGIPFAHTKTITTTLQ